MLENPVSSSPRSDDDSELVESPRLPVELERLIFELAFDRDDPRSNTRMALVARRVYSWLMPLMYCVFVQVWGRPLYPDLEKVQVTGSLPKICHLARFIVIDGVNRFSESEAITDLLDKCHNLENLSCCRSVRLEDVRTWSALSKLRHIRRLCGSFRHIMIHQLGEAAFAPNLTHLLLARFNRAWRQNIESGLFAVLPNLTHFGLSWAVGDFDFCMISREVNSCAQICVFVYFAAMTPSRWCQAMFAVEPRMAIFHHKLHTYDTWIPHTTGQPDLWNWAEGFVFARQHGYFNSNDCQKLLITHDFSWRDLLTAEGIEWYEANVDALPGRKMNSQELL